MAIRWEVLASELQKNVFLYLFIQLFEVLNILYYQLGWSNIRFDEIQKQWTSRTSLKFLITLLSIAIIDGSTKPREMILRIVLIFTRNLS